MARQPLAVWLDLDRLHCYDEGDGAGSAEPYLWTVFFKVDGDTVVLGDDLFLHGTATVVTTPGSHGNLGDSDVDGGDDVSVPSAIGDFQTTLRPIPVPDWVRNLGTDSVGGACGVVSVLMEEDWVSDSGAEAGHAALNTFVQQAIDGLIPQLGITHPEVTDADITALTAGAEGKIADAVQAAQGAWDNFTSWLNSDDHIGDKTWTFSHDTLVKTPDIDFSQRWKNEGDWELFGHVHASPTCPADAVIEILSALGFLRTADAESNARAAREFRTRAFGGRPDLGAWWHLAERNAAAISATLRAHPTLAKGAALSSFSETFLAMQNGTPLSDKFVKDATELLQAFAEHGPRRLRIDAKAAMSILPELRGKTFKEVTQVFKSHNPTRKSTRLPRRRK